MSATSLAPERPPALRQDLIIRPAETAGQFVVKQPADRAYFHVGEQEHFLLRQLDGTRGGTEIRAAFEQQFAEPLSATDLDEFVRLASRRGLLQDNDDLGGETTPLLDPDNDEATEQLQDERRSKASRQTLLHYRFSFFDPDRLFNLLEPRLRFVWSRGFLLATILLMATSAFVAFTNREQWISTFPDKITWETVLLVWALIFVATLLHEFAHGLTCKHFGGEVHEIGFLLLFFMPCFYCNVSDAWLFRERWKRLWVGFAGTYFDLVMWALATLVWRITVPETALNYFAWLLSSVCGGRCLFNLNPLLKMDGYYLLSDWARIPNLADRGRRQWIHTLRWLMWGGRRPNRENHSRALFLYGLASWLFMGFLLFGTLLGMMRLQDQGIMEMGCVGIGISLLMSVVIGKNMFAGIFSGEFTKMIFKRRGRAMFWAAVVIGIPALSFVIPYQERAAGTFRVRPSTRIEVNALEAGFLGDIQVEEGSRVMPGDLIARIHIPDLEVNLTKKQAEIRGTEANLRKLEAGPRPEEVVEQRERVSRALAWRNLGEQDLKRAKHAFEEELVRLDRLVDQHVAEVEFSKQSLLHAESLHQQNALSGEQLLSEQTRCEIKALELEEVQAQKRAREAQGTLEAEAELARREKELADQRSLLRLLEAGGRPEEIDAERARLARLAEERKYLEGIQSRVMLRSPVAGVVTTPRMHEKNGQYVPTGTVVCVVEELTDVVAEIAIKEEDEHAVRPGQLVELRARAMPYRSFLAQVQRKAPTAVVPEGQSQGTVTIYCRLTEPEAEILSGMTGYARIYRQHRPLGIVLAQRTLKYLRTEFWWW